MHRNTFCRRWDYYRSINNLLASAFVNIILQDKKVVSLISQTDKSEFSIMMSRRMSGRHVYNYFTSDIKQVVRLLPNDYMLRKEVVEFIIDDTDKTIKDVDPAYYHEHRGK